MDGGGGFWDGWCAARRRPHPARCTGGRGSPGGQRPAVSPGPPWETHRVCAGGGGDGLRPAMAVAQAQVWADEGKGRSGWGGAWDGRRCSASTRSGAYRAQTPPATPPPIPTTRPHLRVVQAHHLTLVPLPPSPSLPPPSPSPSWGAPAGAWAGGLAGRRRRRGGVRRPWAAADPAAAAAAAGQGGQGAATDGGGGGGGRHGRRGWGARTPPDPGLAWSTGAHAVCPLTPVVGRFRLALQRAR